MKVINLFGAPNSGKTTIKYGLTWLMKLNQISCEQINEIAKEFVLKKQPEILFNNQAKIQLLQKESLDLHHTFDFVINDSPLILHSFYHDYNNNTHDADLMQKSLQLFNSYSNINFFIKRSVSKDTYESNGRIHQLKELQEISEKQKLFLDNHQIPYHTVFSSCHSPKEIFDVIKNHYPWFFNSQP